MGKRNVKSVIGEPLWRFDSRFDVFITEIMTILLVLWCVIIDIVVDGYRSHWSW